MADAARSGSPAPYEDVLVQAIDLLERSGAHAVESLLTAHPEHAERLRDHLSRLRGLGLAAGDEAAASAVPERLGDFRLLRRLGGGGMGVVYLARQQSLQRDVALKLVRQEHLYFPGARERFRREVAAVARLQHPGIVPVYDAGEDAGVPWLAMEHVAGASLDVVTRHLAGRDPATLRGSDLWTALAPALPEGTAAPTAELPFTGTWVTACLHLMRAIALALHHAHERGVLHRDLKPSNVMLTPDGRALLLDFGLALAAGDARMTRSGSQLGTLAYMAPEQVRGELAAIDARSDVYSLGITAYELLTLQLPFAGGSDAAIREQVLAGQLPPLRERNRAVPRDVDIVLRKACDIDPARRYGDAAAFAADLGNLLELRPIQAQAPRPTLLLRRWAQRHPARAVAITAGLLLFLVAPSVFLLQAQAANRDIQQALDTATEQRRLADLASTQAREQERATRLARDAAREQRDLAREAVDTLLERVANEQLLQVPRMHRVRRDLLERARTFYERFLAAAPDDLAMLEQTARATLQMVFVEGHFGQVDFAASTVERAVELTGLLRARRPGDDEATLLHADAVLTRGRVHLQQVHHEAALDDFDAAAQLVDDVLTRAPQHARAIAHRLGIDRGVSLAMRALGRDDECFAALQRVTERWQQSGEATRGHEYREAAIDHVLCAGVDEARFLGEMGLVEQALATCDRVGAIVAATADETTPLTSRIAVAALPLLRTRLERDVAAATRRQRLLDCLAMTDTVLAESPENAPGLRLRATIENDLGLLDADTPERRDEAIRWFERSLQTLRDLVAADPTVVDNRANLAATLVNLGSQFQDAGEHGKALQYFAEAEPLAAACCEASPGAEKWQLYHYNAVWFVGQTSGELGDHAAQAAAARRLVGLRPDDAKTRRIAAELLAQALTQLAADDRVPPADRDRRRGALEVEALQQLQRAAELGYADHARLRDGGKLAPLRALPGFAAVLARVTANAGGG